MYYIAPNSTIKFLKGVPLDNTYDHTIYWNTTSGGGGATAQYTYFNSKVKPSEISAVTGQQISFSLGSQSYQRVKRGYIRCEIPADNLYDCNYLMFQNTNFGARWFYAFITSVEYVNNLVSEVQYEIDVMQTWHFDYELEDCFVEREHTATDVIGEHTVPENLEIGDYLFLDAGKTFQNKREVSDFSICIASTWVRTKVDGSWRDPEDAAAGFYNGVYSGLHYTVIPLNKTDSDLRNAIAGILGDLTEQRKEEIVGIYMIPSVIVTDWNELPNQSGGGKVYSRTKHYSWSGGDNTRFEPVNKKLYTYPYNTFYVTSSDGDSAYFKYELFTQDPTSIKFVLDGAMGVPPELALTPINYSFNVTETPLELSVTNSIPNTSGTGYVYETNYSSSTANLVGRRFIVNNGEIIYTVIESVVTANTNGFRLSPEPSTRLANGTTLTSVSRPNYNFTLSVKNFPMCSWITDAFKAWLAQNSVRLVAGFATTVAGAFATGGVIGATATSSPWMTQAIADARQLGNAISAGSSVANSLMQIIPASLQPDHAHGVNKAMVGMANGEFGYHFYYARIKDEYARIIDDYFTRYGYAVKRNKKPNRNARPHWTYIKAIGCTIKASIPAPDTKAICEIYNNGITFWKNASEVGDYSLDNRPVTT